MKFTPFICAILLSLQFSNSLAADFLCKPITGTTLQGLMTDIDCMVYKAQKDHFPSLIFLISEDSQNPFCYSATFEGTLGKKGTPGGSISIEGTTFSGLTQNQMNVNDPSVSPVFTAASVISINNGANGKYLGDVYTQDLIITDPLDNNNTRERLVVVDGIKNFKGTKGHLEILGNALAGPTTFAGTLCIAKKLKK
jgi:hypothetical protein